MDSTHKDDLHDDLLDWAIVGASHMAHGLTDYASWSREMLAEEHSESVRAFLPVIFENSKKILEGTEDMFETAEQRRPNATAQGNQDFTREATSLRDPKRDSSSLTRMMGSGVYGLVSFATLGLMCWSLYQLFTRHWFIGIAGLLVFCVLGNWLAGKKWHGG